MNVAAGSEMPVLSDTSFPAHPTTALPNAKMIAVVLSMSCPPLHKALNNINGSYIGAVTIPSNLSRRRCRRCWQNRRSHFLQRAPSRWPVEQFLDNGVVFAPGGHVLAL